MGVIELLDKIIEIAKCCCREEDVAWGEDTSILTDMSLSSLEIFDFIFKVETQFSIHFLDRELSDIVTLGDLEEAVRKKIGVK